MPGETLAVMGPANSGKSGFIRMILGEEAPREGRVHRVDPVAVPLDLPKRTRLAAHLRKLRNDPNAVAAALTATRLWDCRQSAAGELSEGELRASRLTSLLVQPPTLAVVDGDFDALDPWTRAGIYRAVEAFREAGGAWAVSTQDAEWAEFASHLVVLNHREIVFCGTPRGLTDRFGDAHELIVETEDRPAVRALVDPFEVTILETPGGLLLRAREGQDLAARLLSQGYGVVRTVLHRPPSFPAALQSAVG
jgi:ABC-type multidrug transport system ATPase subunit